MPPPIKASVLQTNSHRCPILLSNWVTSDWLAFGKQTEKCIEEILDCKINLPDSEWFSDLTPQFFNEIGFDSYSAIDKNSKMSALPMDLNADLSAVYGYNQIHSLVIDNGTGEHIFDQLKKSAQSMRQKWHHCQ